MTPALLPLGQGPLLPDTALLPGEQGGCPDCGLGTGGPVKPGYCFHCDDEANHTRDFGCAGDADFDEGNEE